MSLQLQRRLFTAPEYYQMVESGILSPEDRVELIEGEIITMAPIGVEHAACVNRLNRMLSRLLADKAIISIQNPIHLNEYSEPQPDIALLRERADFYASAHPEPVDTLLLIEVAETSFEFDQTVKIPLYAQAGIVEVWVVNLKRDVILVYRQPTPDGYRDFDEALPGDTISPLAFPDLTFTVEQILGMGSF